MTSFSTNCLTAAMISVWNSVRPTVWASLVMRCLSLPARSAGDRFGARQAREVGGRQSKSLGEQVGGVLSQGRRRLGARMGAVECGRHAGREIVAHTGL